MSTLNVNSIVPANAGSEDYFLARAWVNFNGTGTVAIRADGNVSSITDNGTGFYTTNFSSSLSDANYSTVASGGGTTSYEVCNTRIGDDNASTYTTSSVRVHTVNNPHTAYVDRERVLIQVAR